MHLTSSFSIASRSETKNLGCRVLVKTQVQHIYLVSIVQARSDQLRHASVDHDEVLIAVCLHPRHAAHKSGRVPDHAPARFNDQGQIFPLDQIAHLTQTRNRQMLWLPKFTGIDQLRNGPSGGFRFMQLS